MPANHPFDDSNVHAWTEGEEDRLVAHIRSFEVLVPHNRAAQFVAATMQQVNEQVRNAPLPEHPFFRFLAWLERNVIGLSERTRKRIEDDELARAIRSVVICWLRVLRLAHYDLSINDRQRRVYLDDDLLPREGAPDRDDEYKTWLEYVIYPLSTNNALSLEGATELVRAFANNLKARVDENIKSDPKGLLLSWESRQEFRIAKDADGYYIIQRRR